MWPQENCRIQQWRTRAYWTLIDSSSEAVTTWYAVDTVWSLESAGCVNVAETAGCANMVARGWLSGRCERVEFMTVSVEIRSEEFL